MKKKVKVNFGSFKNAKIGTKLSIAIGVLTTVCLIVLNLSAISISGNALDQTTDDQIVQVCQTNVEKVNTVMQVCNTISDSIKDSLELMYDKNYDKNKSYKSQVNGKMLSKSQYDAENAMLSNIWAAVSKNDNILGAGVLFEPNAFSSSIKDYSVYGYKTDLETRTTDTITYESNSIEDFYSVPKNEGAICFSEPYEDGVTKDMVMSVGYPITGNGEFKGIVLLDVKSNVFNVLAAKNEQFPSLHINIMNGNGMILYDSIQSEIIGGNISDVLSEKEVTEFNSKSEKKEAFEMTTYPEKNKTFCYFTPVQIGNSTWWIQTALLSSEFNATNNKLKLILNFIAILAVIIAVICTYIILKRLLKPIVIMEKAAVEMSKGSLNVEIDYESKDELGRLADSMRTMMVSINTIISDMVFGLEELANGNFNIEVKNKDCYIGDYLPLKNSVEVIITKLNQTLGDIKVASDQVNSGADQVSSAAQALSQGATEQASAVEELSATMTEMSGKIQHNADKSDEARLLSQAAGQEVKVSNQKMEDMSSAMADITDKSNEIGKIIKTIDDIAFQTNILALNAAVEAARAGAAGKGFAVVADEVRNLASKSAEAAKNTTVLIESAVEAIANGDRLTNETAESLMAVSENTEKIAKLIDEISIASNEQSVGVSQINTGLEQISSVVQTNSATAEESAAASEELSGQANTMNVLISEFQLHD